MEGAFEIEKVVELLGLEKHIEGGYYRRTFCSSYKVSPGDDQGMASSIFYLLSIDAPIGHFHLNQSDILHFHHGVGVIRYHLIDQQGEYTFIDMGGDLSSGQQLQLLVAGGTWKASELLSGPYSLISEVVIPEFRFEDMKLAGDAQWDLWKLKHPSLKRLIK